MPTQREYTLAISAMLRNRKVMAAIVKQARPLAMQAPCTMIMDGSNPSLRLDDVYGLLKEWGWVELLGKVDPMFNQATEAFLDENGDSKRVKDLWVTQVWDHFWLEIGSTLDGDLFEEAYNEARANCEDADAYQRDPYMYHGVGRHHFASVLRVVKRFAAKSV
jgi:hypothetical protein